MSNQTMKVSDISIINLTPENIADYGVCGYKNVNKHVELRRKIEWFKDGSKNTIRKVSESKYYCPNQAATKACLNTFLENTPTDP